MERFLLMARLFKEWVPRDLFGAIQMRSQVSMMMVNAPGIYVGFLLGRELTWRKGNPKGMRPDESLDTLPDHGIGLARSRLESHS